MKHILIVSISLLILLNGCGGGSASDGESSGYTPRPTTNPTEIEMRTNKTYTVYPGDKVVKTSDDAEVRITHIDGQTTSTITLVAGDAKIIRH
jgi:uncharacterized lipoprotein YehR (DUF1307 family)